MSFAVCAVMVVAGLGAQAATVSDAINTQYVDEFTPIIFEDNDYGLVIDNGDGVLGAGDLIIGIIQIQAVTAGLSSVGGTTGIRDVTPGTGTNIGSGTNFNELTAVFGAEITSSSPYTSSGKSVWSLKAISGSITFPKAVFTSLAADWVYTFNTAGNMVDLYEDSGKDFNATKPNTAGNGTFVGGLGMTDTATSDPDYGSNSKGEFWFVEDNDTDPLPDTFQLNLSLVDYLALVNGSPGLFGYGVYKNDISADSGTGNAFVPGSSLNFGLGVEMFADGIFKAGGSGWSFTSDGDFKVLFAPLPTAIWPAMLLLGALGLVRRARRKTA
jgi:hypothetical protein